MPRPPRFCTVEGCEKRAVARGWCHTHYQRWKFHGDPNYVRPPLPHGASMYTNKGCRCDICRAEFSQNMHDYMHDPAHPERLEKKRVHSNVKRGRPPETKFQPAKHGGWPGINQHRTKKTPYCPECQAFMDARLAARMANLKRDIHGTLSAHRQHYRDGEKPCEKCRLYFNEVYRVRNKERRKYERAAILADMGQTAIPAFGLLTHDIDLTRAGGGSE